MKTRDEGDTKYREFLKISFYGVDKIYSKKNI